jgi:hypothetical protein
VFPLSDRRHHENVYLVDSDADVEAFNSFFYATNDFLYGELPFSRPISPNMGDMFHGALAVRFVDASNFKTPPWRFAMTKGHSALKCLKPHTSAQGLSVSSNSGSDESVNHFTHRAPYWGSAVGRKCQFLGGSDMSAVQMLRGIRR